MKARFRDLCWLRPFDESSDAASAGKIYAQSTILSLAVLCSAFFSIASLVLSVLNYQNAVYVLAVAVGASAITVGMEWHAQLRARALNQLFAVIVVVLSFWLFNYLGIQL